MFIPFFVASRWKAAIYMRNQLDGFRLRRLIITFLLQWEIKSVMDLNQIQSMSLKFHLTPSLSLPQINSKFFCRTQWQTPRYELWPMRRSLRLFGGKTIVRNECGTVGGKWRRKKGIIKGIFGNTEDMSSKLGTPSKTLEEMRTYFNINKDYTPEGEADVRKENAWAFE
ncbi:hypothetical protein Bca4012_020006 [Brassica carinata]